MKKSLEYNQKPSGLVLFAVIPMVIAVAGVVPALVSGEMAWQLIAMGIILVFGSVLAMAYKSKIVIDVENKEVRHYSGFFTPSLKDTTKFRSVSGVRHWVNAHIKHNGHVRARIAHVNLQTDAGEIPVYQGQRLQHSSLAAQEIAEAFDVPLQEEPEKEV